MAHVRPLPIARVPVILAAACRHLYPGAVDLPAAWPIGVHRLVIAQEHAAWRVHDQRRIVVCNPFREALASPRVCNARYAVASASSRVPRATSASHPNAHADGSTVRAGSSTRDCSRCRSNHAPDVGAAVSTDDRRTSGHDSIVGAGATLGQHDVPSTPGRSTSRQSTMTSAHGGAHGSPRARRGAA